LRVFPPVTFEVFFSQEIMRRDKEIITMNIFTNLDFMILLFKTLFTKAIYLKDM
jgi:hypothetical protein